MGQFLGVLIIVQVLGVRFRILGGQDLWPVLRNYQGVLVLARPATVGRLSQPARRIGGVGLPSAGVNHRFHRDRHPLA